MESTTVTHSSVHGVYFTSPGIDTEGTDGFSCLLRKTQAKRVKRNCQSSEANKLPQRDSNPGPPGRQSNALNPLGHRAPLYITLDIRSAKQWKQTHAGCKTQIGEDIVAAMFEAENILFRERRLRHRREITSSRNNEARKLIDASHADNYHVVDKSRSCIKRTVVSAWPVVVCRRPPATAAILISVAAI